MNVYKSDLCQNLGKKKKRRSWQTGTDIDMTQVYFSIEKVSRKKMQRFVYMVECTEQLAHEA